MAGIPDLRLETVSAGMSREEDRRLAVEFKPIEKILLTVVRGQTRDNHHHGAGNGSFIC